MKRSRSHADWSPRRSGSRRRKPDPITGQGSLGRSRKSACEVISRSWRSLRAEGAEPLLRETSRRGKRRALRTASCDRAQTRPLLPRMAMWRGPGWAPPTCRAAWMNYARRFEHDHDCTVLHLWRPTLALAEARRGHTFQTEAGDSRRLNRRSSLRTPILESCLIARSRVPCGATRHLATFGRRRGRATASSPTVATSCHCVQLDSPCEQHVQA